jgi:hypothetical protein
MMYADSFDLTVTRVMSAGERDGITYYATRTIEDLLDRYIAPHCKPLVVLELFDHPDLLIHLGVCETELSRIFWDMVVYGWSGFQNIPNERFQQRFEEYRKDWQPGIMDQRNRTDVLPPKDPMVSGTRAAYDLLPDRVQVYRGQGAAQPIGLSWALEPELAAMCAHYYRQRIHPGGAGEDSRCLFNRDPIILTRTVDKNEIAFLSEETEAVLFSAPTRDMCDVITYEIEPEEPRFVPPEDRFRKWARRYEV